MKYYYQLIFILLISVAVHPTLNAAQNPRVVLETNFGDIVIELYPDDAPITVDNFLSYVNSGFYDGVVFHRVIEEFMIQAGIYFVINNYPYNRIPGDPIVNESDNGLSNVRGTISTALGDGANTATSQFFINHVDNTGLDYPNVNGYGHCVFGAVVVGMDVIDAIAQTPTYDYRQWFGPAFKNFPDGPLVIINLAYEIPGGLSHCSDFVSPAQINLKDFAMFSSHWLDENCNPENSYCGGTDLDYSGGVDIIDLELFLDQWTHSAGYEPRFSDLFFSSSVEMNDLIVFTLNWLDSDCHQDNNYCDGADINRDGTVDLIDYSLFSNNWLTSY